MIKICFITEKYHTGPTVGLTNNIYNLFGSFNSTGFGIYENYFIDPEEIWSTSKIDHILLTKEYDVAVISVYHILPSIDALKRVGNKTCFLWWDGSVSIDGMKYWSNFCQQICFDYGFGKEHPDFPNINCLSVPQDPKIFYKDDDIKEEFDVSFVGSLDAPRPDRRILMEKIKLHIPNIWFNGGRGIGPEYLNLPIEEYANIFRKSKICLNIQAGHGNKPQKKGRSYEIAAMGKFMLANNPQVFSGREGVFFEDGPDFISFDDSNVVEKIKYYLDHEEERKQIANNLYNKYCENYSPKHFWSKILNICGVNCQ